MGLQETGIGPRKDGMEAVKGAVRRWAKRAGIQAGIWMACGATKRRSHGGARAGVALLMLPRRGGVANARKVVGVCAVGQAMEVRAGGMRGPPTRQRTIVVGRSGIRADGTRSGT